MLHLSGHRRNVPLLRYRLLLRCWTHIDAAVAAVVADAVDRRAIDHRRVVHVVNVGDVHVVHRTVVVKLPVLPPSALVAIPEVAIAVTDASVETDLLTPIAVVKDKPISAPTPVRRSPEQTWLWRHDPCAWH